MVEFGITKFVHFRMKRFDLPRRDTFPRNVVQRGDGSSVRGLESGDALDERRHLMTEQSQVGRAGGNRLERFHARFDPAQARLDAADVGLDAAEARFDAAEAAVDRTQQLQSFGVGHRFILTHFVFADYDQCAIGRRRLGAAAGFYFAAAVTAEAKVASRLTLQYSTTSDMSFAASPLSVPSFAEFFSPARYPSRNA
jgi:hypothetical protein